MALLCLFAWAGYLIIDCVADGTILGNRLGISRLLFGETFAWLRRYWSQIYDFEPLARWIMLIATSAFCVAVLLDFNDEERMARFRAWQVGQLDD